MNSSGILELLESRARESATILMFSGGRDSTLGLKKLLDAKKQVTLVTVTSGHLLGIELVKQRLKEIEPHLQRNVDWIAVKQPANLIAAPMLFKQTCLPCHHAYSCMGAALCKILATRTLAFGYVAYQNAWPEQTPLAIQTLRSVLEQYGIGLVLPVEGLASKEEAELQLRTNGFSPNALEQKCIQQITNVELDSDMLIEQVGLWEKALHHTLRHLDEFQIEVHDHVALKPQRVL